MTKEQLNYIFNKYGGKEKVLGELYYEIYFDNPRNYLPDYELTKEERLKAIEFDDDNELCIIHESNRMFNSINDYMPTNTDLIFPYDTIQGFYILNGLTIQKGYESSTQYVLQKEDN
jgi:hypothetical protein